MDILKTAKMNGWMRLWTVFSVLWGLLVIVYILGTIKDILPIFLPPWLHRALFDWSPGPIDRNGWQYGDIPHVNVLASFFAIGVPVVLLWAAGASAAYIAWICKE